MRKQLLKGFTILTGIMVFAMVAAVASANGQARSNVPFDFTVGNKTLPAGKYTVASISSGSDALIIRNVAGKASAARLTMPAEGSSDHAKLVFHRYGQRYFLAEVWNGENQSGRRLAPCQQERAIQKELSSIASWSSKPAQRAYETVEVAFTVQ